MFADDLPPPVSMDVILSERERSMPLADKKVTASSSEAKLSLAKVAPPPPTRIRPIDSPVKPVREVLVPASPDPMSQSDTDVSSHKENAQSVEREKPLEIPASPVGMDTDLPPPAEFTADDLKLSQPEAKSQNGGDGDEKKRRATDSLVVVESGNDTGTDNDTEVGKKRRRRRGSRYADIEAENEDDSSEGEDADDDDELTQADRDFVVDDDAPVGTEEEEGESKRRRHRAEHHRIRRSVSPQGDGLLGALSDVVRNRAERAHASDVRRQGDMDEDAMMEDRRKRKKARRRRNATHAEASFSSLPPSPVSAAAAATDLVTVTLPSATSSNVAAP